MESAAFCWREFDAARINQVLNHPEIHPWVAENDKPLDISGAVANKNNVLLMGEWGGCFCIQMLDGIYEVHTQVLPEGRGQWALDFVRAGSNFMFTQTNCYEIVTRVPEGHIAAKALTLKAGMRFDFRVEDACRFKGELLPVDLYSFRIQDWIAIARDLEEIGEQFHELLTDEAARLGITEPPHELDEMHNRYVGAAYKLISAGHVAKGVTLYNRWAFIARHPFISIVDHDPITIKMDIGLLRFRVNGGIEVSPC